MFSLIIRSLVCAALLSAACFAQLDNASLFGTVTDPSGGVVAAAEVKILNIETAQTLMVATDSKGNYFAPVLAVGTYRITVGAPGFRTKILDNYVLRAADRSRLNVSVEVGSVQESVTVKESAPLLDVGSSAVGGVVSSQQIAQLPVNGRDLSNMLALIPGANLAATPASMSMNGMSMYRLEGAVKFLVDGADASRIDEEILDNDYGTSKGRITRSGMDGVEEVRIQTSSFSAEYGNALSGVMNVISKSGTNTFHGSLFEYFRNEKLDARNYFNVGARPEVRLNQFGGSVGGPIVKDKLFFFLNYEGVRQRTGVVYNSFVPTAAFRSTFVPATRPVVDLLPLPNGPVSAADPRVASFTEAVSDSLNEDTGSAKIDYVINPSHRLSVRYNGNGSLTNTNFGIAQGQVNPAPGLVQLAKTTYTATLSPSLLNEAGFAVNRVHIDKFSAATQQIRDTPIVSTSGALPNIGPQTNDNRVGYTLYSLLDTVSWVKGRNQFKFGVQSMRPQENRALLLQRTVTYQNLADFAINSPLSVATSGQPRAGMRGRYNDFFVQDDIQLNRRVTINAGLRYQYDTAPTEEYGRLVNFDFATGKLTQPGAPIMHAPTTNFAPRLGIAISPFGNDRTVIRTAYGIYFAALNPYLAQPLPNNIFQQASSITRQQVPTLVGFPFPVITSFAGVTSLTALPQDYKGVYNEQWNFDVEQALDSNSMIDVGYLGSRGLHLNSTRNANRFFPGTSLRPYPAFGTITYYTNGNISAYEGLHVSYRHRFARGVTANVNYRWSHSLDNTMAQFGSGPQDDANQRLDYSSSDTDVRHQLQFDASYAVPRAPFLPKVIGSGWQLNTFTVMRSGLPVNVTCGCDPLGIGNSSGRPNYVYGAPLTPANYDLPSNQFNIKAFTTPKGSWGTLGRNVLTGPSDFNWDSSLFKNFRLTEHQTLQFRAEAFNLFNTPQFSNPGGSISSPANFGRSGGTATTVGLGAFGSNRQLQFALRLQF